MTHVPLLIVKHVPSDSDVGPTHVIVGTAFVTRKYASVASAPHDVDIVGSRVGTGVGAVGARVGCGVGAAVGAVDDCTCT